MEGTRGVISDQCLWSWTEAVRSFRIDSVSYANKLQPPNGGYAPEPRTPHTSAPHNFQHAVDQWNPIRDTRRHGPPQCVFTFPFVPPTNAFKSAVPTALLQNGNLPRPAPKPSKPVDKLALHNRRRR